jgi:hypothetical protein
MLSNDTSFALIGKRLEPVASNRLLRLSDVYDYTIIRHIIIIRLYGIYRIWGGATSYNLPPLLMNDTLNGYVLEPALL